jgi:hypothetical protein
VHRVRQLQDDFAKGTALFQSQINAGHFRTATARTARLVPLFYSQHIIHNSQRTESYLDCHAPRGPMKNCFKFRHLRRTRSSWLRCWFTRLLNRALSSVCRWRKGATIWDCGQTDTYSSNVSHNALPSEIWTHKYYNILIFYICSLRNVLRHPCSSHRTAYVLRVASTNLYLRY